MERLPSVLTLDRVRVGELVYRPIARALGITAFGINAYTGDAPGDVVIECHDAPPGTLVFARPEQRRGATALEPDTTILVIGGKPGAAGPPSPFEYWYRAEPAYRAGDYEQAYAIASEGLEHHPDNSRLHYQLGCFAALGGRRELALEHLERAFAIAPETREWAKTDADLASLHL